MEHLPGGKLAKGKVKWVAVGHRGGGWEGEWTLVSVVDKDGKTAQMWAYDGKPLYHWMKDMKAGDATGDGVNGFHLAK